MRKFLFILAFLASTITTVQANDSQQLIENKDISRYPVPKIEDLPTDIKEIVLGAKKHLGYVPNVLLALAHRPDELRAFLAYHKAIMLKESGLTKVEKEMLIVAHSSANGCIYCVVSHGANLRVASKNPILSDQITANYHEADITSRQKAILDFAMKITNNSKEINKSDFKTLHTHGLNDEDIWDIAAIASFFNMSNRMMNFAKVRPNDELYKKGR